MRSAVVLAFCSVTALAPRSMAEVRVQVLSVSLIRLEEKGPHGFEDRPTFLVQNRAWPGAHTAETLPRQGGSVARVGRWTVWLPPSGHLAGAAVKDNLGRSVYVVPPKFPLSQFFPGPSAFPSAVAVPDSPRLVPAPWGATPPPETFRAEWPETSGWDISNPAPDVYVFLNNGGGYRQFVSDYLRLTGPSPLPPLYVFGLIDSRYHPYTQEQALGVIDKYRQRGFPLDMFVVDTDWRVGASKGYAVNTRLWPDMAGFLRAAHERGVRTMFNDHPEPQAPTALDPKELQYRWDGLTGLLGLGADVWWYDRNWVTHLKEPVPGLRAEIWGARMFQDITSRFRPDRRPLIMANVQGIDNGVRNYAPQAGFHRYPIYWTGDTGALWPYLRYGIANAVDGGVESLLPFMSEDLTGHWGHPTQELYVRFMQYGCLSPITRIHCTAGETRLPWDYGEEAEAITREYVKLRYRLLPTIYSAAFRAHADGTPVVRRLDLEWPDRREAKNNQQYLLGDDLLVAPVNESKDGDTNPVPSEFLRTHEGQLGLTGEYFANQKLEGEPALRRVDQKVDFDWGQGSPAPQLPADGFSARWTGRLGPMPETGDYILGTRSDDGSKLYLDGRLVVASWKPQADVTTLKEIHLEKGKTYDLEMDYFEAGGDAVAHLVWVRPGDRRSVARRRLWLPPGDWIDAWSGAVLHGPKTLDTEVPLARTPLYVRAGGIVFTGPQVMTTWHGLDRTLGVEAFAPRGDGTASRTLYQDDGMSQGYLAGQSASTAVTMRRSGNRLSLTLAPTQGHYSGQSGVRALSVKLNLPPGWKARDVRVNGRLVAKDWPEGHWDSQRDPLRMPFSLWSGRWLSVGDVDIRKRQKIEARLVRTEPG